MSLDPFVELSILTSCGRDGLLNSFPWARRLWRIDEQTVELHFPGLGMMQPQLQASSVCCCGCAAVAAAPRQVASPRPAKFRRRTFNIQGSAEYSLNVQLNIKRMFKRFRARAGLSTGSSAAAQDAAADAAAAGRRRRLTRGAGRLGFEVRPRAPGIRRRVRGRFLARRVHPRCRRDEPAEVAAVNAAAPSSATEAPPTAALPSVGVARPATQPAVRPAEALPPPAPLQPPPRTGAAQVLGTSAARQLFPARGGIDLLATASARSTAAVAPPPPPVNRPPLQSISSALAARGTETSIRVVSLHVIIIIISAL